MYGMYVVCSNNDNLLEYVFIMQRAALVYDGGEQRSLWLRQARVNQALRLLPPSLHHHCGRWQQLHEHKPVLFRCARCCWDLWLGYLMRIFKVSFSARTHIAVGFDCLTLNLYVHCLFALGIQFATFCFVQFVYCVVLRKIVKQLFDRESRHVF